MKTVALALLAAAIQTGCASSEPVRFGVVLDNDGALGAQLAARDVNAAGGIGGRPLELQVLTGQSSTEARIALAAADNLALDEGIVAVVGHTNSSASLAASQVYNARRLPQIAPTSSAPHYSDAGPYSFRMIASDVHQGAYLTEWGARLRCTRPAVVYVNDDYGRGLHGSISWTLAAKGISAVHEAPFGEGTNFGDPNELARAIASAKPDLVIWGGRSPELRQTLPALRRLLPRAPIIASDGVGGPQALSANHGLPGVQFVRFMDWQRPIPAMRDLQRRYREAAKFELTDQAALSYDAVMLLAQAAREASPNREEIRRYLERVGHGGKKFEGATGPVVFDERGDRTPTYSMHLIGDSASAGDCGKGAATRGSRR